MIQHLVRWFANRDIAELTRQLFEAREQLAAQQRRHDAAMTRLIWDRDGQWFRAAQAEEQLETLGRILDLGDLRDGLLLIDRATNIVNKLRTIDGGDGCSAAGRIEIDRLYSRRSTGTIDAENISRDPGRVCTETGERARGVLLPAGPA